MPNLDDLKPEEWDCFRVFGTGVVIDSEWVNQSAIVGAVDRNLWRIAIDEPDLFVMAWNSPTALPWYTILYVWLRK